MYTKTRTPLKSEKDLYCFRTLRHCWIPHSRICIPLLTLLGFRSFKSKEEEKIEDQRFCYYISSGYIPTYSSFPVALSYKGPHETIYLCKIPKGTPYFQNEEMYASKQIKFIKKL